MTTADVSPDFAARRPAPVVALTVVRLFQVAGALGGGETPWSR